MKHDQQTENLHGLLLVFHNYYAVCWRFVEACQQTKLRVVCRFVVTIYSNTNQQTKLANP